MNELQQLIVALRMKRAAYKQLLTNLAEKLSQEEVDDILDQILEISVLIKKLEKGL